MTRLLFSPAATADIDSIWDYTADRWGPDQADAYIDAIQETCVGIANGTRHVRPALVRDGTVKALTGSHVVFARQEKAVTIIVRILHRRMDPSLHVD